MQIVGAHFYLSGVQHKWVSMETPRSHDTKKKWCPQLVGNENYNLVKVEMAQWVHVLGKQSCVPKINLTTYAKKESWCGNMYLPIPVTLPQDKRWKQENCPKLMASWSAARSIAAETKRSGLDKFKGVKWPPNIVLWPPLGYPSICL